MARTSRNGAPGSASAAAASSSSSANVDALDNLNLDDMFADDGDALFDGLDIDLGNMDDIAESSAAAAALARSSSGAGAGGGAAPLHLLEPPSPASVSDGGSGGPAGRRRTTKRKIKSPMFYEDEDDDYVDEPTKKKKRGSNNKAAAAAAAAPKLLPLTKKRGGSTKGGAALSATGGDGRKAKPGPGPAAAAANIGAGAGATAVAPGGTAKGKKGQRSLSMPPPAGRAGSVAAAGQFGGRQKKGGASSSFSIPSTTTAKGKGRAAMATPASPTASVSSAMSNASSELLLRGGPASQRPPSAAMTATVAHIHATHPGLKLSSFCGLLPSNTLFYPFMPALPQEPSFKHRKVFAMIDRIHTSFMSHVTSPTSTPGLPPALDTESIFQLMQDAFREEKPSGNEAAALERSKSIGNAISALRRSIGLFDKSRLAGDLLAVCALLKRQYDFLTQNLSNMDQWCKNHFPEAEYAAVYHEPKSGGGGGADGDLSKVPVSVLATFKNPEIKVKVLCSHFKEPKAGKLVALLPPRFLSPATPSAAAPSDAKPAAKVKKRKLAVSPLTSSGSRMAAAMIAPTLGGGGGGVAPPKPAVTYAEMRPAKRRKSVSDLIAKTARELEAKYSMRFDDQRTLVERQQNETRQLVEDDPIQAVHTMGMWRWLEKAGYFARITDVDIRWRLEGGVAPDSPLDVGQASQSQLSKQPPAPIDAEDSMASRLEYLLCACSDDETDHSVGDDDLDGLYEIAGAVGTRESQTSAGFQLKLDALGLNSDALRLPLRRSAPGDERAWDDEMPAANKSQTNDVGDSGDEIGDIINSMIGDLQQLNHINNRRTAFVESMAIAHQQGESSGRKAEDASLIARCQQLLRKSKEAKGKNGKLKTAKKDEYALPW